MFLVIWFLIFCSPIFHAFAYHACLCSLFSFHLESKPHNVCVCVCVCVCFVHAHGIQKFQGQGSNSGHSSDDIRSLTCCVARELQPSIFVTDFCFLFDRCLNLNYLILKKKSVYSMLKLIFLLLVQAGFGKNDLWMNCYCNYMLRWPVYSCRSV